MQFDLGVPYNLGQHWTVRCHDFIHYLLHLGLGLDSLVDEDEALVDGGDVPLFQVEVEAADE